MGVSKVFAFSYSRLHDYETCPRQYEWKHIEKHKTEPSDQQLWGISVHKALDARATGVPLPKTMAMYEKYGRALDAARDAGLTVLPEQQYALDRNLHQTDWFSKDAYCRVVIDAAILGNHSGIIIDYKTGKKRDDPLQLMLNAAAVFSIHPNLQTLDTRFVWLQGEPATKANYPRSDVPDMWKRILFKADCMERAIEAEDFRPKPSGLCRLHCPVTSCEHNGRHRG